MLGMNTAKKFYIDACLFKETVISILDTLTVVLLVYCPRYMMRLRRSALRR